MGAVSTVGTLLDTFRTKLVARTGLAGVAVHTGAVDEISIGTEAIVFAVEDTKVDYRYRTLPHLEVFEEYVIEGRIWIVKAGGGETVIKSARDRALAILEEVADELATDNTSTATTVSALGVNDARLTGWTLSQYPIDGGRDCRIAFNVDVSATFTPT
jgi:hypothetical protein